MYNFIRFTICSLFLLASTSLIAQEDFEEQELAAQVPRGRSFKKVSLFAGYSQSLRGFTNPFIVHSDQSDYLQTPAYNGNLEFEINIARPSSLMKDIWGKSPRYQRVGFNLAYHQNANKVSKTLPVFLPTDSSLPRNEEEKEYTIELDQQLGVGAFYGMDDNGIGIDVGMIMFFNFVPLPSRSECVTGKDSSGNDVCVDFKEIPSRGTQVKPGIARPSLRLRFGDADDLNLSINVYRQQYNNVHDIVNAAVRIPVASFYAIEPGIRAWPHATIFLTHIFHGDSAEFFFRSGFVVNYQSSSLEKVAFDDAWYGNIGASVRF